MDKKTNLHSRLMGFALNNKALLILVVLMVVAQIASGGLFFSYANLSSVSRQVAVSMLLGFGFTVVLASGGLDLSVGNMLSCVGVLYAIYSLHMPLLLAIILAIMSGAALGLFNGAISVKLKLTPFIVTLATAQIFKSVAYLLTNGKSVTGMSASVKYIGQGLLFGVIPFSIVIAILMCLLMCVVMYRTSYGRHVIATGGNQEASRVSGINTNRIQISAYMVMGIFVALASIVLTGRVSMAAPGAGEGMEMDAIAAVVIGGTPLSGGKAKMAGTIFGCMVMGVMNNLLNLVGVSSFWQWFAKGCIIIIAIFLDAQTENFLKRKQA
ncbi:MAG: ABC transporter permease [Clostridiales bacterium]|nr:ABC transporter permease [Clostridiales bacterium]